MMTPRLCMAVMAICVALGAPALAARAPISPPVQNPPAQNPPATPPAAAPAAPANQAPPAGDKAAQPAADLKVTVLEVKGNAIFRPTPEAKAQAIKKGIELPVGAEISTSLRASVTLQMGPNATVKVGDLTVITIGRLTKNEDTIRTLIGKKHGKIDFNVAKAEGLKNDFVISVPGAQLAVRGTSGTVYNMGRDMRVVCHTGQVRYGKSGLTQDGFVFSTFRPTPQMLAHEKSMKAQWLAQRKAAGLPVPTANPDELPDQNFNEVDLNPGDEIDQNNPSPIVAEFNQTKPPNLPTTNNVTDNSGNDGGELAHRLSRKRPYRVRTDQAPHR